MPTYTYTARNRSGQQLEDVIQSDSQEQAIQSLRQQGLLPIKIKQLKDKNKTKITLNPLAYRSVNSFDIEHQFHQIAVMLRSGISLLDALNMIAENSRIGTRKFWRQLAERVQQGSSFQDAMSEHSVFTPFTTQLVHVGEQTGHLGMVMDQAADELKASRKIRKQITSALKYPAFTLLFAIGLVVFMLTSIVPEIKKLLKIMGKPMPPITQALIDISDWFISHAVFMGVSAVVFVVVFIVLYNWKPSRWWIDRLALGVPMIGYVLRLSGTVLFSRAMGLLLRSGVVMVDALETMQKLHVNTYMASRVAMSRLKVMHGSSLTEPLEEKSGYMELLIQMLKVGENSGTLDDILQEMTDYHEELLEQQIAKLTGMIAPLMTIIVGGIVGFVYAAFLVAMFSAAGGSPS